MSVGVFSEKPAGLTLCDSMLRRGKCLNVAHPIIVKAVQSTASSLVGMDVYLITAYKVIHLYQLYGSQDSMFLNILSNSCSRKALTS